MNKILSSEWGGLSEHLIASFYEVDRDGRRIDPDVTVRAPLTDSNFEITLNWNSPFENQANFEQSTLQQMLQSGAIEPLARRADGAFGTNLLELAASVEGRTSITKLNSTQVFVGEQPAKFNVTALFRAWKDPKKEVHEPFDQLMKWALPIELAKDGLLLSRLATEGPTSSAAFPSKSPTLIAVKYKDCTYSPLVIESIVKDTNAQVDKNGYFVELAVPMLLTTLTAIDRQDWSNFTGH
jgi:hypothetical protein